MEELEELKKRLEEERPMVWDGFPDIGLYMDQVISYVSRQLITYDGTVLLADTGGKYVNYRVEQRDKN